MRLAVISDLHANARALRAALARVHAVGVEQLVINGDLLTYGIDIDETLDLVEAELQRGAALTIGNHDQLYLDLVDGNDRYYRALPPWLRETVDYTVARLDASRFRALPWQREYSGIALVAHANPFTFPDWTYLDSDEDLDRALVVLAERGIRLGVFGHTHRARSHGAPTSGSGVVQLGTTPVIVNAGSVGQPRNKTAASTMLWVEGAAVRFETLAYDVAGHLAELTTACFSAATLERLTGYFRTKRP